MRIQDSTAIWVSPPAAASPTRSRVNGMAVVSPEETAEMLGTRSSAVSSCEAASREASSKGCSTSSAPPQFAAISVVSVETRNGMSVVTMYSTVWPWSSRTWMHRRSEPRTRPTSRWVSARSVSTCTFAPATSASGTER